MLCVLLYLFLDTSKRERIRVIKPGCYAGREEIIAKSLILEDFEGLASEAQFNKRMEDLVIKLLKTYRRASKQDEGSTGELQASAILFSECGNFYKTVAAQCRSKKMAAAKQKRHMPPEECQKFLEAQLTDDGFGFPGMEEQVPEEPLAQRGLS